jgi:predicted transcriptional regulator
LKLSDELKTSIQSFAAQDGVSAHAFMINALERAVARAKARKALIADAEASLDDALDGGPLYAAEDVHRWARARLRGEKAAEPKPLRSSTPRAATSRPRRRA